tara:strand:+ start:102 stop:500 length:399 start_codon:yes stop_codon:yes gene_type:complete
MSLIKANDITNVAGGIPTVKSQQLIPTAWVNFNGTGTVAIRDSEGVSSIGDNGTGDYTINFSTNMPNTNYAVCGSCSNGDGDGVAGDDQSLFSNVKKTFAPATTSIRVGTRNVDANQKDMKYTSAIIMGGQA